MTKPGNTAGLYYTAVASQEHWEKWKFLSRPASSAFLQHTVSHGCIPLHTHIWNWGAGELSLTASTSAPGKADGSAEVCLPQTLEWTGNCMFSLKGAFFSFECFLEFTSHHSPCCFSPVKSSSLCTTHRHFWQFLFQKYLKRDCPENKA